MAGRTPFAAAEAFRDPLQLALSCVTRAVIRTQSPYPPDGPHYLTLSENPARIGHDVTLSFKQRYALVETGSGRERWQVRTTGYSYQLSDADGWELVVYQWDPDPASGSPVMHPHLHIGRSLAHPNLPPPFRERVGRLVKAHLPTGPIMLTEVLRAAIADLGIAPRRLDWEDRLNEAEEVLRESLAGG